MQNQHSGLGSAGGMVRLHDLRDLFQPKLFCDSEILSHRFYFIYTQQGDASLSAPPEWKSMIPLLFKQRFSKALHKHLFFSP